MAILIHLFISSAKVLAFSQLYDVVHFSFQYGFSDEWHSVPIVPITEDHQNALSNKLFRQMLRRVGISPPAHKQVYSLKIICVYIMIHRSNFRTEAIAFFEQLNFMFRSSSVVLCCFTIVLLISTVRFHI